jgi:NADH-quinone oxidoreductase subunit E
MKNKILLIDDDQVFVTTTKTLLESEGYTVLHSERGQEGFQKAKDFSPDIIVLDMMMSYSTEGQEVAKALAGDAATRSIPVLLLTAVKGLTPDPKELPVKLILEKPLDSQEFLKIIAEIIAKTGEEHRQFVFNIERIAAKWKGKNGNLIMVLHEIQNTYGYVPRKVSFELSRLLDVPLARIYEVITFYNYFKLDPPGKHLVSICMGTACYLKGTPKILDEIKNLLHIQEGQTTKDGLFHLQIVRCLGCCGLAPVMMIDEKIYGKVKKEEVANILADYS